MSDHWSLFAVSHIVILSTFALILGLSWMRIFLPYIQAAKAGVGITFLQVVSMRLRRIDPYKIITAKSAAQSAGIDVTMDDLEAQVLAGGDPIHVIDEIKRAQAAGVKLTWNHAAGCDLAGLDPMRAAREGIL
jgi:uncharacterized protein YqfA (UPF0365 family)